MMCGSKNDNRAFLRPVWSQMFMIEKRWLQNQQCG